ncbi:MAG: hypothetical protein PHH43_00055 [Candidatus Cloacimonetes bacterium]|jgi:hypothetical protein|nr:hypothetical protein [Candidatus Cloacimonadota bacterium]MDD3234702.1 hypothetical protein [Candidatus Cloacimonadota bacterium]
MIPKNARIQQTQFVILESSVKVHIPKDATQIDLCKMPIEIDFDILQDHNSEPYAARVVMTIKSNNKKEVPGYAIFLKVGGEYKLSEELEVMGEDYRMLVSNSAVACLINESRVYLQTLTAFFPFGSYIMPMIDMNNLWEQKTSFVKDTAKEKEDDLQRKKAKTTEKKIAKQSGKLSKQ